MGVIGKPPIPDVHVTGRSTERSAERAETSQAAPHRPTPHHTTEQDLATHNARDLVAGGEQARIILDGQVYTLRITRAGKLILTK